MAGKKTPISRVLQEVSQGAELRQPLLNAIGKAFDNRFATAFYTSFESPAGGITDKDADMLSDLLDDQGGAADKGLVLLLHSPGGSPTAAERIIKVCRHYSKGNFVVLVPSQAKSAATLISFGANRIFLSESAELGPIDVQVGWGGSLSPAYAILEAYDKLLQDGINLGADKRIEPILQQLQVFDPAYIAALRQISGLSADIAVKALRTGMMKGVPVKEIRELVAPFVQPEKTKVHARAIDLDDIRANDKKKRFEIESVGVQHSAWKALREYHIRAVRYMSTNKVAKLVESPEDSYYVATKPKP